MGSGAGELELCSGDETSLAALLPWARRLLTAAGIESAGFEMQLLLAQALNVSRIKVLAATYPPPSIAQLERFVRLVRQRAQRVPLAYLRGDQEFYGLPFRVTSAVLIPRPETEMLVDLAIREYATRHSPNKTLPPLRNREAIWIQAGRGGEVITLADVGAGTGCIAIAVLASCPNARAVAYDLSDAALALARKNAVLNGVVDRLRLIRGDLLTAASACAYDLIVSNPPYIPTADLADLQPEVRDYEPRLALDGGATGLDCYVRIARDAARALKPGGSLLLEVGQGQARAVAEMLLAAGLTDVNIFPDLAGIDRVVQGTVSSVTERQTPNTKHQLPEHHAHD